VRRRRVGWKTVLPRREVAPEAAFGHSKPPFSGAGAACPGPL
jgi:hypothetical protein